MSSLATKLADWAAGFEPSAEDLALADRSLRDTTAVVYAARGHPLEPLFEHLAPAGRQAARAHVLDYDDLHMPSTAHISAVCVAAALATGGGARAYLAGAGVMARLGSALGWRHYSAGWHATCTAGAPAAAVAAAIAYDLSPAQTATAIALAIPAAGGVQRAFGTAAKSLQVGFAADAGVRAAELAAAGASADATALEQWLRLVGGNPDHVRGDAPEAVPGGLAIKLYPCCYALQRPISALTALGSSLPRPDDVTRITVTTPSAALAPLIHSRPRTGLEGKFSLEYAIAATLLDRRPGLESFTDAAVNRAEAQHLIGHVDTSATDGGANLLDGAVEIELHLCGGDTQTARLATPPGAPDRPPTPEELREKLEICAGAASEELASLAWETVPA